MCTIVQLLRWSPIVSKSLHSCQIWYLLMVLTSKEKLLIPRVSGQLWYYLTLSCIPCALRVLCLLQWHHIQQYVLQCWANYTVCKITSFQCGFHDNITTDSSSTGMEFCLGWHFKPCYPRTIDKVLLNKVLCPLLDDYWNSPLWCVKDKYPIVYRVFLASTTFALYLFG